MAIGSGAREVAGARGLGKDLTGPEHGATLPPPTSAT